MPEKIKPELLQLIEPSALPCRILVVESLAYLPRLFFIKFKFVK